WFVRMTTQMMTHISSALLCGVLILAHHALSQPLTPKATAETGNWWESAAATIPVFLRDRPGKDAVFPLVPASAASKRLDEMRAWNFRHRSLRTGGGREQLLRP